MKPAWFVVLALGLVLGAGAQTPELVYSANPQYPPYHWAEGDQLVGASVELLNLVLPPGVKARPVVLPWKRVLDGAADGSIDLVLSLRKTPERQKFLTFVPHRAFPNPIVVFARQDAHLSLRSWDDLKGHPGGVSAGDQFGNGFDEFWRAQLTVETADTMVENFRKLGAGRIEWFVTSRYVGEDFLKKQPSSVALTILEPPISNEAIYLAFSSRSPWVKLIPAIEQRLEDLDRQGTIDAVLRKWLAAP